MRCEDCGCNMTGGLCPNCSEEAWIFENQIMALDDAPELSQEFADKVGEQLKERDEKKRRGAP